MVWHDAAVGPVREDRTAALNLLGQEGFRMEAGKLVDREGHAVRFSLLTNAGNRSREKMAALIQQDLAAMGMEVNVVTLDFPALIERLMHTQNYEAALLGLSNVEPDPSTMENIWVSSSPNHQWNPGEKTPATAWEAEIDRLMAAQAAAANMADRKRAVDRVQEIVAEQQPFVYLVYPNALYGVAPKLEGVVLTVLQPGVVSAIEANALERALSVASHGVAALLEVRLRAGYGKQRVLDGVEFALGAGDRLGLVGTSGAGKSTLVLALLGLLPWRGGWAEGEVRLEGVNLLGLREREARRLRGRRVALVPQSPMSALNGAVTLRKHFEEAWRAHEREAGRAV